jgi:hypothetical protein
MVSSTGLELLLLLLMPLLPAASIAPVLCQLRSHGHQHELQLRSVTHARARGEMMGAASAIGVAAL